MDAVIDVHFVAHLAGWLVKVMILRDIWACWISSVAFELCELTFRHWLPNFYECWWDHVSSIHHVAAIRCVWMQLTRNYLGILRRQENVTQTNQLVLELIRQGTIQAQINCAQVQTI